MSVLETLKPTTLEGVKRLAKRLKKQRGVTHAVALAAAAKQAGFESYEQAHKTLP